VLREAASHVSAETQAPEVPWRDMVGTRIILAHAYFHVDQDIIGHVVDRDIPRSEEPTGRNRSGLRRPGLTVTSATVNIGTIQDFIQETAQHRALRADTLRTEQQTKPC